MPRAPLALGLAGLIPFWGLALALLVHGAFGLDPAVIDLALATYAAIIVSFLGGIRWGLATRADDTAAAPYALSVVPSLVAWAALAAHEPWRLAILGLVALALGPLDLGLVRSGAAPAWFGRLRLILSTGAGVALLLAAWG
ncbi:MAG: DUF3429 domain-containing protein [Caulobacteraceae bacterium]|nr:DUF3429 domain-containing protein [Caulobacter sp.]